MLFVIGLPSPRSIGQTTVGRSILTSSLAIGSGKIGQFVRANRRLPHPTAANEHLWAGPVAQIITRYFHLRIALGIVGAYNPD
jgi:hypothetical protein